MQGGPGQVAGVMIQEGADIAVGICRVHIVHGPTVLAQFLREDFHAGSLMDEFLAMKIELTKKEPFFDNPGRGGWTLGDQALGSCPDGDRALGGCPLGDQALGLNKLVRQEQKIQAGFCGVHFKGTTRARGSLSGPGVKFERWVRGA